MAISITLLALLTSLLSATIAAAGISSGNPTLVAATREMQKANYFAFVMLINMSPTDRLPPNITFLMPNDRMLAKASIPRDTILGFLLHHSIPSPLLFDHLERFPTGSIVPSSEPGFGLKISNNGRKNFHLNNVKIISPNICVSGSSIRCHGIDGVLDDSDNATPSTTPCSASPAPVAAPPAAPPALPPMGGVDAGRSFSSAAPAAAPQPSVDDLVPGYHRSSGCSSRFSGVGGAVQGVAIMGILVMLWRYL